MKEFVEAARAWAEAMRRGLENRDTATIGDLAGEYDVLERRGRALARELHASRGADEPAHDLTTGFTARVEFIAALRDLQRAAHVCAALSESEALYLRWGQTTARPAREYSARGEPEADAPASTHWEA